jgi:hypothetical protein
MIHPAKSKAKFPANEFKNLCQGCISSDYYYCTSDNECRDNDDFSCNGRKISRLSGCPSYSMCAVGNKGVLHLNQEKSV